MSTPSFALTTQEASLVNRIVTRAVRWHQALAEAARDTPWQVQPERMDGLSLQLDLVTVHNGDFPLDLDRLLKADNGTFAAVIYGILADLDRATGQLPTMFKYHPAMSRVGARRTA